MIFEHRAAHRRRQGRCMSSSGVGNGACSSPRSSGFSPAPGGLVVFFGGLGWRRGRRRGPPASIDPRMTAPTATVSPAATCCSPITPATGDGTSTRPCRFRGWRSPRPPRPLRRASSAIRRALPSVIDSPSAGTLTSVAMVPYLTPPPRVAALAAMTERLGNQGRLFG